MKSDNSMHGRNWRLHHLHADWQRISVSSRTAVPRVSALLSSFKLLHFMRIFLTLIEIWISCVWFVWRSLPSLPAHCRASLFPLKMGWKIHSAWFLQVRKRKTKKREQEFIHSIINFMSNRLHGANKMERKRLCTFHKSETSIPRHLRQKVFKIAWELEGI